MKADVLSAIRQELVEQSDDQTRESFKRFFKEEVTGYGVKTPIVTKIAGKYFKEIKQLGKKSILTLCEELLKSGIIEEAFIACDWSYSLRNEFEETDFALFESWVKKYVDNWATCDTLCNHTIGAFIDKFPSHVQDLKRWAHSENRWLRRASAVTLILPAREGKFLNEVFEVADILLEDKDDLVQKGYGWLLKEASRVHQKEVLDYIMLHKKVMPRTALRYAIEKMPENLKRKAMEKG